MFYWMIRVEVDCCISSGWFSIYVYFEVCLFACYSQGQKLIVLLVSYVGLSFMLSWI